MLDIKSDDDMHSSIDRASTHRRCDVEWGNSSGALPERGQAIKNAPSSIPPAGGFARAAVKEGPAQGRFERGQRASVRGLGGELGNRSRHLF